MLKILNLDIIARYQRCARKIVSAHWQQHFSWIIAIVDTRAPNLICVLRKVEALTIMLRNYEALGQIRCNQVGRSCPHQHISHEVRIFNCVSTSKRGGNNLIIENRHKIQSRLSYLSRPKKVGSLFRLGAKNLHKIVAELGGQCAIAKVLLFF